MLKNKKSIFILGLLLFFLILPRILVYFVFGPGLVGADAEGRYFPQVEQLSESFTNFFSQTGPLYSLFLMFFDKINNNMVAGPVLIQHILGIITALIVFYYFRKINLPLAFFVTILTYSSWIALWLEHTILRDSLAALFAVLLVILASLAAKEARYFKFLFAILVGLIGLILVFIRIEFIVLFILMPLIIFVVKKRIIPGFRLKDKKFWQWNFGYFLPLLIVLIIYSALFQPFQMGTTYGSFFNIAYLDLIPDAFYYENSNYPELLEKYQGVSETNAGKRERLGKLYEVTEEYLSGHPEIELSYLEIMDRIYIEIMTRNTLVYLKSFSINFKNNLLGIAELNTLISKDKITDSGVETIIDYPVVDKIFHTHNIGMKWFSIALFLLFLISLPFLIIKWRSLPPEIVIAFLVCVIHISVLAFLADANHRFRYPLDPFFYFFQFYLISILLRTIFIGFKNRLFVKKKE
ncbi:MAG: hypothetical protein ABII25_01660 [bacterium]